MEELKRLIRGSYGIADRIFAGHPNDAERARQSIIEAKREEIDFDEFLKLHENYLKSLGCVDEHVQEQLQNVQDIRRYFR